MKHFALSRYHAKPPRKDQVDRLLAREVCSVSLCTIILALCSMLLYIYSVLMEIYSCYAHLYRSTLINALVVILHTFLCHCIINTLSLSWYIDDNRKDDRPPVSIFEWALRYLFHILPFGPVVRYCTMIKYVRWSLNNNGQWSQVSELILEEHHNTTLLCFFKSLLVNSPHILLSINLQACTLFHLEVRSLLLVVYVLQMAWAIAMHHRAVRACDETKNDISWLGTFCQAVWRTGTLSSRFLSLGAFSCSHWVYFMVGCGMHWAALTAWAAFQPTKYCPSTWQEWLFKPVLGLVHLVCYFSPSPNQPTFWRYLAFYTLVGCENLVCISLWYFSMPEVAWPHYMVLGIDLSTFVLGITAMILYYCHLHPNGNLSTKMKMSNMLAL